MIVSYPNFQLFYFLLLIDRILCNSKLLICRQILFLNCISDVLNLKKTEKISSAHLACGWWNRTSVL